MSERGRERKVDGERVMEMERKIGSDIHRERQEKESTKIERGRLGKKERGRGNFFIQWDNTDNHFDHILFL